MNYHSLNEFVELLARGEIEVHGPVKLSNVTHNTIHNVPFLDHCEHLCKKHDTNMLKLLSVIQQKLNNDMILRLKQSPVFNDKLKVVAKEWGEDIDPYELFRCPGSCYDSTNYNRIHESVMSNDDDYSRLDGVDSEADSGIYEMMERLKGNYYSCGEDIQGNLSEIEQRRNEYNPQYRDILCDLSTKHKSYYLDDLLSDDGNGNLTNGVNRRINKRIPENIHVIFLNNLLIPNLMNKCMEKHRYDFMQMKESLENKQTRLNDVMVRIGPSEPLSDSIVNLLQGFKNYFDNEEDEEDLPSDDEEPSHQIKVALDSLINRSNELSDNEEDEEGDDEDDEDDEESSKQMYHLKVPENILIQDMGQSGPLDPLDPLDPTQKQNLQDLIAEAEGGGEGKGPTTFY